MICFLRCKNDAISSQSFYGLVEKSTSRNTICFIGSGEVNIEELWIEGLDAFGPGDCE